MGDRFFTPRFPPPPDMCTHPTGSAAPRTSSTRLSSFITTYFFFFSPYVIQVFSSLYLSSVSTLHGLCYHLLVERFSAIFFPSKTNNLLSFFFPRRSSGFVLTHSTRTSEISNPNRVFLVAVIGLVYLVLFFFFLANNKTKRVWLTRTSDCFLIFLFCIFKIV